MIWVLGYFLIGIFYALKMTEELIDKKLYDDDENGNMKVTMIFLLSWVFWVVRFLMDVAHVVGGFLRRWLT